MRDSDLEELRPESKSLAEAAGARRYNRRRASNSVHRWNRKASDHSLEAEIESVGAEIFAGEKLMVPWVETDLPDKDGDLGDGIQIRHTRYLTGKLLLHKEDCDSHLFFLVVGCFPAYAIAGFISGSEGKKKGIWEELTPGRPCFTVKQFDLNPLDYWFQPLPPIGPIK